MAGLVPAIHVVRRIKRAQAASRDEKPCACRSLQRTAPIPDSSLRQSGVDGRDKPGHDDKGSKAQSARTGPVANAISAGGPYYQLQCFLKNRQILDKRTNSLFSVYSSRTWRRFAGSAADVMLRRPSPKAEGLEAWSY